MIVGENRSFFSLSEIKFSYVSFRPSYSVSFSSHLSGIWPKIEF